MIDVSCKYEPIQKRIHFPFFLSFFFFFPSVVTASFCSLTSLRNLDNKQGILKVMLHGTIRNDDFQSNAALQHCCDIVSNGCNIVPLCYAQNRRCESSRHLKQVPQTHSFLQQTSYCELLNQLNELLQQSCIQCTIWGQLIKDTKFVIASHAHTITIPY